MLRNKLSKWKAVVFKNMENRTFASLKFGQSGVSMAGFRSTSNLLKRSVKVMDSVLKKHTRTNLMIIFRLEVVQKFQLDLEIFQKFKNIQKIIQLHPVNYSFSIKCLIIIFYFRIASS